MELKLRSGIDELLFGASIKSVEKTLGKYDEKYTDEDGNIKYQYNKLKLTLTFYKEADFKLAYINCSSEELEIFGRKLIGKNIDEVLSFLEENGNMEFDYENYDSFATNTNEENWLVLNEEYGEVNEVEIGVIINDDDEYEWKV